MNFTKELIIENTNGNLENHLPKLGIEKVESEIFTGLKAIPKYISPKYFYDEMGSELFEEITELDEYYPTKTEKGILVTIASKLNLDYSNLSLIELGSGDASKIRLLINQIPKEKLSSIKYYPIDISQSAIEKSSKILASEFSSISIRGIVADFIHQKSWVPKSNNRLFCFFGSTIGNMTISETKEFLKLLGSEMGKGDSLLLGMDMVKDLNVLVKAYNDEKNITAQFNKNILNVVNKLVGLNFNADEFEHLAFYNKDKERIEMHLKAKKDMIIKTKNLSDKIFIRKGETIHTENSHKFTKESIEKFGFWAKLKVEKVLTDKNNWFSLIHFRK